MEINNNEINNLENQNEIIENPPIETPVDPQVTDAGTPPVEDIFQPITKIKVLDEEKDLPEWATKIQTKDNANEIKDLFEKAYGLPSMKERLKSERDSWKTRYEEVHPKFEELRGDVERVMAFKKNGDLGSVFKELGIGNKEVVQYAIQLARLQNASPEEREAWEHEQRVRSQNATLSLENQRLQQQQQMQMAERYMSQLNETANSPIYAPIVREYDGRLGQQGAFLNEVIRVGKRYEDAGMKPTIEQVVREVAETTQRLLGLQAGAMPPPMQQQTSFNNQPATPTLQQQPTAPVIPNVGGGGSPVSVVKQKVASYDDLKRLRAQVGPAEH